MLLDLLFQSPALFAVWLLAIISALTVHEFSHALAAYALGDTTARDEGRLTLNPIAHIDWVGFLLLMLIGFGWGKPVPFNPYRLRLPRVGPVVVGLAGPFSNLLFAMASSVIFYIARTHLGFTDDTLLVQFCIFSIGLNVMLMLFNLIPVPPLDGSKVLLALLASPRYDYIRFILETRGPFLLLGVIMLDRIAGTSIIGSLLNGVLRGIGAILG